MTFNKTDSFKEKAMNEFPLLDPNEGLPLFYPYIAPETEVEILGTLKSRWIGQGPKVELFEKKFKERVFPEGHSIATGSGTDSLHLAYILAGVSPGDEVITPVFTCTATNIPLLYIGAKPVFSDIDKNTLNININDIESRITEKTKAVVAVDYGGTLANYSELNSICTKYGLTLISDAAQSIGAIYKGKNAANFSDFTAYSFQGIKTITTGDGGMLCLKDTQLLDKAKRLRWFGIDRQSKQKGTWDNDIYEIGYKYQLTDVAASLGLANLIHLDELLDHRRKLLDLYIKSIDNNDITVLKYPFDDGTLSSPWLCTILVNGDRIGLMRKLRSYGIESGQVHYRNDRYSIFGGRQSDLPNMDDIEEKYLVLPLHHMITPENICTISDILNSGW